MRKGTDPSEAARTPSADPHAPRLTPHTSSWRPSAPLENLRRRAAILAQVREFFAERGVMEVETPLLSAATVTDLHLESLETALEVAGERRTFYLQTSPELAMKRLLAAGSGPIYQLGKAFRAGEAGRRHNPEFTMLEWYRPGWDHHSLMDEVEALLVVVLGGAAPAERLTYREALVRHAGVDPFTAGETELSAAATVAGLEVAAAETLDRDGWLQLLQAEIVEPRLGRSCPSFLYDFPASQAALARLRPGDPPVAERFEAYVAGVELANGYHELTDPDEQAARFARDLAARRRRGLPTVTADQRLLAALRHGLPPGAGVALGFDRLVMLALGADRIDQVVAFSIERA